TVGSPSRSASPSTTRPQPVGRTRPGKLIALGSTGSAPPQAWRSSMASAQRLPISRTSRSSAPLRGGRSSAAGLVAVRLGRAALTDRVITQRSAKATATASGWVTFRGSAGGAEAPAAARSARPTRSRQRADQRAAGAHRRTSAGGAERAPGGRRDRPQHARAAGGRRGGAGADQPCRRRPGGRRGHRRPAGRGQPHPAGREPVEPAGAGGALVAHGRPPGGERPGDAGGAGLGQARAGGDG